MPAKTKCGLETQWTAHSHCSIGSAIPPRVSSPIAIRFVFDSLSRTLTAVSGRYSNTVPMTYDKHGQLKDESQTLASLTSPPTPGSISNACQWFYFRRSLTVGCEPWDCSIPSNDCDAWPWSETYETTSDQTPQTTRQTTCHPSILPNYFAILGVRPGRELGV